MNRRLLFLNLLLLAAVAGLVWTVRVRWIDAQNRERAMLQRSVPPRPIVPLQPVALPAPARPTEYVNVAQQMLFSRDRNPNVEVLPPPPPPPPKPVPPLPAVHGSMSAFGDHVVLLSLNGSQPKGYRQGDKIGEFKILEFDSEKIKFEW